MDAKLRDLLERDLAACFAERKRLQAEIERLKAMYSEATSEIAMLRGQRTDLRAQVNRLNTR